MYPAHVPIAQIGMGDQIFSRSENAPSDPHGGLRALIHSTMPRKSSLAGSVHRSRLMPGGSEPVKGGDHCFVIDDAAFLQSLLAFFNGGDKLPL